MQQKVKEYKKEFNKLNKNYPLKLVSRKVYFFCVVATILLLVFLALLVPTIVYAQVTDKIDFENGIVVLKISHEITPETFETIIKYFELAYNNVKNG